MRLKLVTAATADALALEDLKLHLGVSENDASNDARITQMLQSAQREFEKFSGRILLSSTWDLYLNEFPTEIELPAPLISVTSIKYQDTADAEQTLAAATYVVDTVSEPGSVTLAYGQSWPSTYAEPNVIVVRFTAGYANAGSVPAEIRDGLYLWVEGLFDGSGPVRMAAYDLWADYKRVPV